MSDDLSELDSFNEKLNKTTATEAYPAPPQALTIASEETEENSPTKSKDASMWAVQGTNYFPCDESVKELASAQYEVCYSPNSGYFFRQTSVKTDELLKLPDSASEEVIQNIENFWTKEAHFRSFGFLWKRGILLWGPAGCHPKGTKVIMFDGSTKDVSDVKIGDILMGPDSKPRHVLELKRGVGKMYKVSPTKGKPFIVNEDHILALHPSSRRHAIKSRFNMKVSDFLKQGPDFRKDSKLYRAEAIDWHNKTGLPIPPYILGLWLGDGNTNQPALTTMDREIKEAWCSWVKSEGAEINSYKVTNSKATTYAAMMPDMGRRPFTNSARNALRKAGVLGNKHIPMSYLTASIEDRFQLLAGLIDSNGHYNERCYDFISKSKKLAENVLFLARSLGFAAYIKSAEKGCTYLGKKKIGTYWRLSISGNCDRIPSRLERKKGTERKQVKNHLVTGFTLEELPEDEYFGFILDQDHLYLLDDFTVTHNSGKTATLQLVAENIIKRGGIAVYVNDPTHTAHGLAVMRKIEPNRPIVVMMEDLDTLLQQHGEQSILALLDGELQVDNVCFIACHSPDTKILTKDLRWVPARDLKEGDELWGFDEHRSDAPEGISPSAYRRQSARRFKTATVVSSFTATKECVRVHLDTGESFVCTTDHPWLSYGAKGRGGKNLEWELAENLLERPNLVRPFLPWEEDTSKDAGWLAGMLDGEGNVYFNRDNGACGIAVCQRLGKTADKLVEMANKFGKFKATVLIPKVEQHSDQIRLRNTGGTAEAAAILGKVRPERLIDNFDLTGKIVQRNFEARVVHIEHIGKQEVQSLETTSKTYFAEGFAVHNTTNYPERLDKRLVNRPSRFDIVKLVAMPNAEARRLFLSKKARNLKDNPAELDKWVKGTEGFSIAHLKELIISVEIFEADVEYAIKRLRKMIDTSPKSTDALRSPGQYN